MNTQRLANMLDTAIAFDTETHKIQPGLVAPPLVCASVARWEAATHRARGALLDREQARSVFLELLKNYGFTIVGANIAFDMIVMAVDFGKRGIDIIPDIFAAYEAGRVFDVQLAEALHGIALGLLGKDPRTGKKLADPITKKPGRYSLAVVSDLVLGRKGAKANDRFRQSYALLEDIPHEAWPTEAKEYPIDDAVNTLENGLAQAGRIENVGVHDWDEYQKCRKCGGRLITGTGPLCLSKVPRQNLHDLSTQCYTHFAMALGAAWGLTPDPIAVARLKYEATKDQAEDVKPFIAAGIIRAADPALPAWIFIGRIPSS